MNFFRKYEQLFISIFFTVLLIGARIAYTGKLSFAFLVWNLLLAVIPLFFSYRFRSSASGKGWLYGAAWLLFLPNAMYIVTDLFHLRQRGIVPVWYDLLILFSAATNGVIAGMISIRNVESRISRAVGEKYRVWFVLPVMMLCAYGIYLGRFERWNSWDVVTNPFSLIQSMIGHLIHPFRNKECWSLTLVFGLWLSLLYWQVHRLLKRA